MRNRGLAARKIDDAAHAGFLCLGNRRVYGKFPVNFAFHNRQIFPHKAARMQLPLQELTGVGVFCRAHQAAGALVQAVERAKDKLLPKARRQTVFQRAVFLPLRALAGQGSGLIDNVKIVVFIDDVDWQKFRRDGADRRVFGKRDLHYVSRFQQMIRLRPFAIDAHAAGHFQGGKLRIGHAKIAAHKVLQLAPGVLFLCGFAQNRHGKIPERLVGVGPGRHKACRAG